MIYPAKPAANHQINAIGLTADLIADRGGPAP